MAIDHSNITHSLTIAIFKFLGRSAFVSILILLINQCSQKKDHDWKVFHYNQPNIITSLDPAFAKSQNNYWAIDHMFNQLVDLDDSLKVCPEIAKRFIISHDGLQYTFHLRDDIYFQDDPCFSNSLGRKLIAEDVVFSFKRLLSPELSAPGRWVFLGKTDTIEPFKAVDDTTFILRLQKPFSPLISMLSMHYCSIIPKEAIDYYGNSFFQHPVGTGPFSFNKWVGKQGIFLKKNKSYYKKGLPKLDGIRISFIEDRNTAFLEFMKKNIDFFSGIQSGFALQLINKDGSLRTDRKDRINFNRGNYLNTEYIGINLLAVDINHPLRDKRFRKALNYSIDRLLMLKTFKFGIGNPAHSGFIPIGLGAFDSLKLKGYNYNPELAKQLLKECQYDELFKSKYELELYTNKDYLDLITFIARQWQEIGIRVRIELMETATLREKMRSGELAMFRASWIADYPDEESFLTVFYGPNPSPPNYTRFSNNFFDQLYTQAIDETNYVVRKKWYQKMDSILIEECPVIFLFYDQISLFSQKNINGIKPNSLNLLRLEEVDKLN